MQSIGRAVWSMGRAVWSTGRAVWSTGRGLRLGHTKPCPAWSEHNIAEHGGGGLEERGEVNIVSQTETDRGMRRLHHWGECAKGIQTQKATQSTWLDRQRWSAQLHRWL